MVVGSVVEAWHMRDIENTWPGVPLARFPALAASAGPIFAAVVDQAFCPDTRAGLAGRGKENGVGIWPAAMYQGKIRPGASAWSHLLGLGVDVLAELLRSDVHWLCIMQTVSIGRSSCLPRSFLSSPHPCPRMSPRQVGLALSVRWSRAIPPGGTQLLWFVDMTGASSLTLVSVKRCCHSWQSGRRRR